MDDGSQVDRGPFTFFFIQLSLDWFVWFSFLFSLEWSDMQEWIKDDVHPPILWVHLISLSKGKRIPQEWLEDWSILLLNHSKSHALCTVASRLQTWESLSFQSKKQKTWKTWQSRLSYQRWDLLACISRKLSKVTGLAWSELAECTCLHLTWVMIRNRSKDGRGGDITQQGKKEVHPISAKQSDDVCQGSEEEIKKGRWERGLLSCHVLHDGTEGIEKASFDPSLHHH